MKANTEIKGHTDNVRGQAPDLSFEICALINIEYQNIWIEYFDTVQYQRWIKKWLRGFKGLNKQKMYNKPPFPMCSNVISHFIYLDKFLDPRPSPSLPAEHLRRTANLWHIHPMPFQHRRSPLSLEHKPCNSHTGPTLRRYYNSRRCHKSTDYTCTNHKHVLMMSVIPTKYTSKQQCR